MSGALRRRAFVPLTRRMARLHHPDPLNPSTKGWRSAVKEADLPTTVWEQEVKKGLEFGLPGASSIEDREIPTFSRGELPHFAGINTFMKAPYLEDVRQVGNYDATVMGVPYDGGTTYRSGTRFGPQGIRRISALYSPYNYELGVDLREQMTLCDAGDVFTIPANIEKTFDQISNAVAHVAASGSFPIILGGDHSIGFPTVRGLASVTSKRIGIIHFDRHADIQDILPRDRDSKRAAGEPGADRHWRLACMPIMRDRPTSSPSGTSRSFHAGRDDAVWMSKLHRGRLRAGDRWPEPGDPPARGSWSASPRRRACGMEIVAPPYDPDITSHHARWWPTDQHLLRRAIMTSTGGASENESAATEG